MRREIYKGHVVHLFVESVVLPNGRTTTLDIVRHPGAAAVVPLHPDGRAILIRQYRHAAGGYLYEIPAGKLDPGESPEACAVRETEEETGYRIGQLVPLTTIFTAPGFCDEQIHLYIGTHLTSGTPCRGEDEVIEVIEMPISEAIKRIEDRTIRDAKSIVALQMAHARLRQEHAPSEAGASGGARNEGGGGPRTIDKEKRG